MNDLREKIKVPSPDKQKQQINESEFMPKALIIGFDDDPKFDENDPFSKKPKLKN